MTSPRNRAPLDRVGQRAAGRRRVTGATAWTAAGGAALAVAFGTVFAQGAAADTAEQTRPAPKATETWTAPAAVQQKAPATQKKVEQKAEQTTAPKPAPSAAPTTKAAPARVTEAPAPPAAAPAAAPADATPAGSTGGS